MDQEEYNKFLTLLEKSHSCYVLVACDGPDQFGNINIRMDYNGDSALASLLVQGAYERLDEAIEEDIG